MPVIPPVIPVKTGIHASGPTGEQECPSSPRHSRENGNPRVRPDRGAGMPVIPPVIPVKTGIHGSVPTGEQECPSTPPSFP